MSQARCSGLKLLSLDGGGVRVYSELIILQEMMERMRTKAGLNDVPRPCEVFDMIAGSSFGGVIALMLGRLEMTVEQAILAYTTLSVKVFSKPNRFGPHKFKAGLFKEALQEMIAEATGDPQTRMRAAGARCKVVVCVQSAHNMADGVPLLFRTYVDRTGRNESYDCTIWEAARATSAYPSYFEPAQVGLTPFREPFLDGGLGFNNPLDIMLEEAFRVFPHRGVSCIVSLGSGQRYPLSAVSSGIDKIALEMLQDSEWTANEAELRLGHVPDFYFRFSVAQGMQTVKLHHHDKLSVILDHTRRYILAAETIQRLSRAVDVLYSRKSGKVSTRMIRRVRFLDNEYNTIAVLDSPIASNESLTWRQLFGIDPPPIGWKLVPSAWVAQARERRLRRYTRFQYTVFELHAIIWCLSQYSTLLFPSAFLQTSSDLIMYSLVLGLLSKTQW